MHGMWPLTIIRRCGERAYIVTAAAASALSGKANAQAVMSNCPPWKKFKGHTQSARTRATDSDASVDGGNEGRDYRENTMMIARKVSIVFPICRR